MWKVDLVEMGLTLPKCLNLMTFWDHNFNDFENLVRLMTHSDVDDISKYWWHFGWDKRPGGYVRPKNMRPKGLHRTSKRVICGQ